ncbi:esterase B1-like [Sitodiplosis mosellana]|uniref:esterase B1-like n=1 Tax=Sitodiplosis mosellana TaxID=263140 RepID=UPI0024448416|nr:esterase B1-like [Sitodiplosis mosellana]
MTEEETLDAFRRLHFNKNVQERQAMSEKVDLQVTTNSGPIVGVLQKTFFNKVSYISYKGIPYAQPPIGPLRFKVNLNIVNPHHKYIARITRIQPMTSLNQLILSGAKTKSKLPVIFYIPGGAFVEEDGSDLYQEPDFMMEENVILVTINYRLGLFGFANFDAKYSIATGNMGLKDQREAFKWIKSNIDAFGGDPKTITI